MIWWPFYINSFDCCEVWVRSNLTRRTQILPIFLEEHLTVNSVVWASLVSQQFSQLSCFLLRVNLKEGIRTHHSTLTDSPFEIFSEMLIRSTSAGTETCTLLIPGIWRKIMQVCWPTSCTLTKNSYIFWIASKLINVFLHPSECHNLESTYFQ